MNLVTNWISYHFDAAAVKGLYYCFFLFSFSPIEKRIGLTSAGIRTYCLDHRSETAHQCAKPGAWATARRKNSLGATRTTTTTSDSRGAAAAAGRATLQTESKCAAVQCRTPINTSRSLGIHCGSCNRLYCLRHRFRDDHDCANLNPLGARPAAASSSAFSSSASMSTNARLAIARLKAWGANQSREKKVFSSLNKAMNYNNNNNTNDNNKNGLLKQSSSSPSSSSSSPSTTTKPSPSSYQSTITSLSLNDLKRQSKGDSTLPPSSRIYLYIEPPQPPSSSTSPPPPPQALFFNNQWSIGRLLDAATSRLHIPNLNNRAPSQDERLSLFHVRTGTVLPFAQKVGELCSDGDLLVLLRGVPPAPTTATSTSTSAASTSPSTPVKV